jgi:hypothetical protein
LLPASHPRSSGGGGGGGGRGSSRQAESSAQQLAPAQRVRQRARPPLCLPLSYVCVWSACLGLGVSDPNVVNGATRPLPPPARLRGE